MTPHPRKAAAPEAPAAGLDAPLLGLPGIGERRAEAYASAGLETRRALLYHLPTRFRRRAAPAPLGATENGRGAFVGDVVSTSLRRRGPRSTVTLRLRDALGVDGEPEGEFRALLFNRAYLAKSLKRGSRVWVAGTLERDETDIPRVIVADYERLDDDALAPSQSLVPIYRLPAGVPPRVHRKALAAVLAEAPVDDWRTAGDDTASLDEVFRAIHLADDLDAARAARDRLARDEAFALSLDAAWDRAHRPTVPECLLGIDDAAHARIVARLPYTPTAAQARVLDELRDDFGSARPMHRLLQGDVGSGKTMIALYALLAAVECGRQAALMAPTEILAEQHLVGLRALLSKAYGDDAPRVALITGRGTPKFRREERAAVADGTAPLAVGTHGLQSKPVAFADLAVTVIDEQHRFGVAQRGRFRRKGEHSHLLVMTATPIPRTLALTAYGELDVSILDELPPGRSPRTTSYVPPGKQARLWRTLREAVERGERGYVVCPSIGEFDGKGEPIPGEVSSDPDDEDKGPDVSVSATLLRVRAELGAGVRVEPVHGRLPPDERDAILDAFRAGDVHVLVATIVVEVGLDVPEATWCVLPAPTRFGLATLHQIRGRVGRGALPGACYLLGPVKKGPGRERVDALCGSEDGFLLAEKDLELRGPGELYGTRQSGMPRFFILDPVADVALLAAARREAAQRIDGLARRDVDALRDRAFPLRDVAADQLLAGG